jgi:hypothetical protein
MNYEIAEFIPSHKARLLRLWLAMTARDPSQRRLKDFFNSLVSITPECKRLKGKSFSLFIIACNRASMIL